MLDIVYKYQNLLAHINEYIEDSKFKKEYLIAQLGVSRATFYNKIKKKSFTIDEMVVLSTILFPEEAKAFEIRQALLESREDSKAGRIRNHTDVMADVRKKLNSLGLQLPEVSTPGGNYLSVTIRGSIAYVAIQFPIRYGKYLYQGHLGREISTQEGTQAMELCALHVLAQIKDKIGFENVLGLNHLDAYFQSVEGWDDSPLIVDGASDLFVKVLGNAGLHSRSILGVERLPRNFCAGLTASITLKG